MDYLIPNDSIVATPFFELEATTKGTEVGTQVRLTYWYAPVAAVLYVIFVKFIGPAIMKNRKPMNLKTLLAGWNLALSVFSAMGAFRLVPVALALMTKTSLSYMTCTPPGATYTMAPYGFWFAAFAFSKYVELLDTAFLVFRKREVNFLHWFHHATVLVYTFDASSREVPIGIYFTAMNYTVHAIMYFYYYLAAVTKPPKWGMLVTVLQISQMFGGLFFLGAACFNLYRFGSMNTYPQAEGMAPTEVILPPFDREGADAYFEANGCNGDWVNYMQGIAMYAAYLYLFCEFFVCRYILTGRTAIVMQGVKQKDAKQKDAMVVDGAEPRSAQVNDTRRRK